MSLYKRCSKPCPVKFEGGYCSSSCRDWTIKKQRETDRRKVLVANFNAVHNIVDAGAKEDEILVAPRHPPVQQVNSRVPGFPRDLTKREVWTFRN